LLHDEDSQTCVMRPFLVHASCATRFNPAGSARPNLSRPTSSPTLWDLLNDPFTLVVLIFGLLVQADSMILRFSVEISLEALLWWPCWVRSVISAEPTWRSCRYMHLIHGLSCPSEGYAVRLARISRRDVTNLQIEERVPIPVEKCPM